MPLTAKRYVCPECSAASMTWTAFCVQCKAYRTFVEEDAPGVPQLALVPNVADGDERAVSLADFEATEHERDSTGLAAVDAVLGGGLVVNSVVLVAAPPGCGKTSLALQILHGLDQRCVYATSEETVEQIAVTAHRVGAASKKIFAIAERDIEAVFAYARRVRARTVVVDSLQKMVTPELEIRAQAKEVISRIYKFAHDKSVAFFVISQVTNEDRVAGGRAIEHDTDVFLELEVTSADERTLRPVKNRFGATTVVGKLRMTSKGLVCADGDGWDQPL